MSRAIITGAIRRRIMENLSLWSVALERKGSLGFDSSSAFSKDRISL
jgi:hypothetical protein